MTLNTKRMKRIGSTLICLVLVLTILTSIAAPPPAKAAAIPAIIITKEMVAIALVILGACGITFSFASSSEAQSKIVELVTNFIEEKPNIEPPDMFPDDMLASFVTTGAIIGAVADVWNQFIDWLRGGGLETVLPETTVELAEDGTTVIIDGNYFYYAIQSYVLVRPSNILNSDYISTPINYNGLTLDLINGIYLSNNSLTGSSFNHNCLDGTDRFTAFNLNDVAYVMYIYENNSIYFIFYGSDGTYKGAWHYGLSGTKMSYPKTYAWLKSLIDSAGAVILPPVTIPPEVTPVPEPDEETAPYIPTIPGIPFDPATYPDAVIEGVGTGAMPVPQFETNPNPNPDPEPEPEPEPDGELDMDKIMNGWPSLTTVFPFSIPWDIVAVIGVFNATPEAPVFIFDFPANIFRGGASVVWDMSQFDALASIVRWVVFILFLWGLLILTGKVIRW